jgi:hypothetical protein
MRSVLENVKCFTWGAWSPSNLSAARCETTVKIGVE